MLIDNEGEVFRRDFAVFSDFLTHRDYGLSIGWYGGQFEEFTDSVFNIRLKARASDRFNNVSVDYNWGEQAGQPIHRISGNLNLRAYGFTARLSSNIQWHFERHYQQILTLAYDFSPALSLESRQSVNLASRRCEHLFRTAPFWICRHRLFSHPRRPECLRI